MPVRRKATTNPPSGPESPRPESVELEIAALGHRGDGIAHLDGQTIFVPYSLPGDRLIVRLQGEREGGRLARIEQRLTDGPDRVQPPCIYFGDCGGCALQHLRAGAYSAWKQALVGDALARQGVAAEVSAMVAIPPGSRRRATFIAEKRGGDVHLGFNAMGSSRVVDLHLCHILLPALVDLLAPLRSTLARVLAGNETADIAVTLSDSGIDLWLKTKRALSLASREALVALAEQSNLARISAGADAEPVALRRQPQMNFSGVAVALPVDSFLQPSAGGEAALVALTSEALTRSKTIADLYAGCGTFSFALMPGRRIHAVEGNAASLAALAAAARGSGGRVTGERRDLAREPLTALELNKFDAIVFDPPRAGAREQAMEIARSKVKLAVAVSCNPVSFARDARILCDAGFHLAKVTPVDQFPWSAHLELVGVFSR
jgi:23S rRNA (uracil1939-C5)-methyltransferase